MENPAIALIAAAALLAANGFFVAAEFSLVKAKVFRVEALAEDGSRSARVTQLSGLICRAPDNSHLAFVVRIWLSARAWTLTTDSSQLDSKIRLVVICTGTPARSSSVMRMIRQSSRSWAAPARTLIRYKASALKATSEFVISPVLSSSSA